MLLPKKAPIRSGKLREAARDQACVRCGAQDGTVVLAHLPYPGGFGMGQKTDDIIGAHLCRECHDYVDGPGRREYDLRFRLLAATLTRLLRDGVVVVK